MDYSTTDSARHVFLNRFSSGNLILDMFLSMGIMFLFNTLGPKLASINMYLIKFIEKLFKSKYKYELTFKCSEYVTCHFKNKVDSTDTFTAIMCYIKNNIDLNIIPDLYRLKEYNMSGDDYYYDEREKEQEYKKVIYIVNQWEEFTIRTPEAKDIVFKMVSDVYEAEDTRSKTVKVHNYTLTLGTNKRDLQYLKSFVDNICYEYYENIDDHLNNTLFVYSYYGVVEGGNSNIKYKTYPFCTTCSIDKIYFDDKKEIMEQIDFFKNNKDWYLERGKPYTLGICTHGIPGCGKTSFEKALCKYLNRHMIIVDFSKIKTMSEADDIFFSEKINGKRVPYNKRIYVFPDIDRMTDLLYSDQYKKNEKQTCEISETNFKKLDTSPSSSDNALEKMMGDKCDLLNMSKILNIFDGVPERTGQIIIMSSNHPEKLDKALLRPGRIDKLIHFQRSTLENLLEQVKDFYSKPDHKVINKYIDNNNLTTLNKKWTPAEIFQLCSQNTNPINCFKSLLNKESV